MLYRGNCHGFFQIEVFPKKRLPDELKDSAPLSHSGQACRLWCFLRMDLRSSFGKSTKATSLAEMGSEGGILPVALVRSCSAQVVQRVPF